MSRNELSLFSYEILGLVGRNGAAPHDLRRLAQRGRMFAWAGESQYYVEPKRLARLGYLSARKEPGRTRERTVYTLTDKGLEALRKYAATPVRFQPLKSDMLMRLLIADLVGEPRTRESIATVRDDLDDLLARLDEIEASLDRLPHRRKYQLLILGFMRRFFELHLELADEVERGLADEVGREPAEEVEREPADEVGREPADEVGREPADDVEREPADEVERGLA
jgi:DNA-binding PadR family transcriptional regulator